MISDMQLQTTRTLISYTVTNALRYGKILQTILMKCMYINDIQYGTPYTWHRGYGFEEWENGRVIKIYSAYYDASQLVYVNIIDTSECYSIYGINVDGILVKGLYEGYHRSIAIDTHKKYHDVYKGLPVRTDQ